MSIQQLAIDLVQYSEDFYEYDFYDTLSEHDNNRQILIDMTENDILNDKQSVLERLLLDKEEMSVDNEVDREIHDRLIKLIDRVKTI